MPSLENGTSHPAELSWWDKSQEVGRMEVYGEVVTATYDDPDVVNFTAQSVLWGALVTAANAMVLGLPRLNRWVNQVVVNANPPKSAINQGAVREIKLMLRYVDATTQKRFESTIPTLNLAKVVYLPLIGNDAVALDEPAEMVALVSAFQNYVVNPITGNHVTVIAAEVVGRNN